MARQKGNTTIVLVVVLIVLTTVAWLLLSARANTSLIAPPAILSPAIQNRGDLDAATKNLDGVRIDSLDNGLNQVQQDAQAI